MTTYIKLVIFALLFSFSSGLFAQRWLPLKYNIKGYKEYYEIGDSVNGKRNGIWKHLSTDSIIYRIGEFRNGVRVGEWRRNYPSGSIRVRILYDSLGRVNEWTRYYKSAKLIEIVGDSIIPNYAFWDINKYEEGVFDKERQESTTRPINTYAMIDDGFYRYDRSYNIPREFLDLIYLYRDSGASGKIKFWFSKDNLTRECYIKDCKILKRESYVYKKNKIKSKSYYEREKLIKTEYYNKKGEITKVK